MGRTVVSAKFFGRGYVCHGGQERAPKAPRFLAANRWATYK